MPQRIHITRGLLAGLLCLLAEMPLFACWQAGIGYYKVRGNHLLFVYSDHANPVKGALFELRKANWASGAPDDQSGVLQGPERAPKWQANVLGRGRSDAKGRVDLGLISPGKYYILAIIQGSAKEEVVEDYPIEMLPMLPMQKLQVLWLNYFSDGCLEAPAVDAGVTPVLRTD